MLFGFVIDQRKCIGCHACTVACKSENEVPVGSNRTWVKYTEKGTFPTVRRHFTVMRCNHCDEAPCVEICPVVALHKRPDAIVDLDRDLCIGCRSCMQACPYDALYLNEDSGVAEKCHYCAHRVERGLEPACVVVCPVHAIISGDTSNQDSEIAQVLLHEPTSQRRLDKGTRPRLWYVDALEESLIPGAATERDTYIWSDRMEPPPPLPPELMPPADIITALNAPHPPVWGWHIWTYLTTKNIAAGAMMAAPLLGFFDVAGGTLRDAAPEFVSLIFLGITSFLLVHDLGRPERFLKIIFHPNTKSWLVKGTWILMAFGAVVTASLAARYLGQDRIADILRLVGWPLAALASGYSAWLFAQCKGRDLWLESGLFGRLLLRASILGAAMVLLLPKAGGAVGASRAAFCVLIVAEQIWLALEVHHRRASALAEHAASLMANDPNVARARIALIVAFIAGLAMPREGMASFLVALVAASAALVGLFLLERSWIKNGQRVPIS